VKLLDGLMELVGAHGPCTIMQLDRFLSEGGRLLGAEHRNEPEPQLLDRRNRHIKSGSSLIEKAIYRCSHTQDIGFARLGELVPRSIWLRSPLAEFAKEAGVGDMAYLWMRCSRSEVWAVCLRQMTSEPAFSQRESSLLELFGNLFSGMRRAWYLEPLQKLTVREREVVRQLSDGRSAKQGAAALNMEKRTYETHLYHIRQKLGAETSLEILQKLTFFLS